MIPYFDYRQQLKPIRGEVLHAVARVLDSGALVLGPEIEGFESEMAQILGPGFGVGLASGTGALELGMRALGVGRGDEVITVPNTAVPTVAAIRSVGARPVFVDVEPASLLMDRAGLEKALSPRTKAVIGVHLFGHALPVDEILSCLSGRKIFFIEDCAQGFGGSYQGKPLGSFGDLACFSFYPTKNLGAYGDAGFCYSRDADLAERLRCMRMYGMKGDGYAHMDGVNCRMDEIHAAILRVKLAHFAADQRERCELAACYNAVLAECPFLQWPQRQAGSQPSHHLYVVKTEHRDRVCQALQEKQMGFGIHYPIPLHVMTAFTDLGYREGDFPVAEAAAKQILSLPLYPGLAMREVQAIAETVRSTLEGIG